MRLSNAAFSSDTRCFSSTLVGDAGFAGAFAFIHLRLSDRAPDKTPDVLLDMLKNQGLQQFNKTDARSTGVGTEGTKGNTTVSDDQGGDARYMAAQALGWLGSKANRPDIVKALEAATTDKDARLKDAAKEALTHIK